MLMTDEIHTEANSEWHGCKASRLPFVCAFGSLVGLLTLVACTWCYAWSTAQIPLPGATLSTGGPWNHNSVMATFVNYICLAGTLSVVLGLICAIFTRTTMHRVFAITSIVVSLVAVGYHVVLID
ncbi:hypothetical protein Poly21_22160 [Allorhodopirellula heiligendammensis]|uniref:Uncharacterized protein n=1 Tax=Allorhodopirellula heiligendammensis TaxID=2714739 RepID=A0A5C6C9E1_9BACT|nr:hypothetical protein Poly21_22160 [Allorhodopirellula heiligendammensis]